MFLILQIIHLISIVNTFENLTEFHRIERIRPNSLRLFLNLLFADKILLLNDNITMNNFNTTVREPTLSFIIIKMKPLKKEPLSKYNNK